MNVVTAKTAYEATDPHEVSRFFTRMRADFNAIKAAREAYDQLGVNDRYAKKRGGALGRRIANIPRPVYHYLLHFMPEVLQNLNLMKQWLRDHPGYLLVDKSRL